MKVSDNALPVLNAARIVFRNMDGGHGRRTRHEPHGQAVKNEHDGK
jgi:hypothetical protein